jgi:O-antigen ligase
MNNPLFGIGLGNYLAELPLVDRLLNINTYGFIVHNLYLKNLAELGAAGFIAYLGMFFVAIRGLARKIKINNKESIFYLAVVAALAGNMLHNMVDIAGDQANISSMTYLFFGVALSGRTVEHTKTLQEDTTK